ncbi:FecR domain-containing protein [Aliifodinibius sp. S!AR15-10]|uniref:FecR domain-containing protein n=1 Tax=Aliifodinibius sp. S!AR15-10 TaxID=2950437 RepID=UPI002858A45E|nr:FecR domain-containing protein [Aliifodinibius sp. S!AR15-10]MDR8391944.1 FecR domain-containing protein [Aliifodinibius sp. S!AR15-10]
MDDPSMWRLVLQYARGEGSPEDREKVEQWLRENPANEKLVQDLEQMWELAPEENFDVNEQEAWEKFHHREIDRKRQLSHANARKDSNKLRSFFLKAAAVILIATLSGLLVWQYTNETKPDTVQHGDFYVMQDLVTQKGEKARVKFSDGTSVILNAASSLRFPKKFNGPKREVYLDGEAFFTVAHNSERPFIVHTQGGEVRVLGTEFNVRAWDEDSSMGVAVRQGKVSVEATPSNTGPQQKVILTRGQYSRIIKGEAPSPAQNIDVNKHLLWLNGGMHFDNAPFSQVVRHIERRFDVQVVVHNKNLFNISFTGEMQNANLEEVLKLISASMEIEYRKEGRKVEFRTAVNKNTNRNTRRQ